MKTKRVKKILTCLILILLVLIFEEGYMLYVNKKNEKDLLNDNTSTNKNVLALEEDINNLTKQVNDNDTEINSLNTKKETITDEIVSVENKIKELEEIKTTIALNTKYINGVISVNQHPNYPTGCESVALYILLRYYNVNVSIDDIISSIPKGDLPHLIDGKFYGANPEKEFVGNPLTDYSYGIFNNPIKDVANMFKSGASTKTGMDFNEVLKLIDEDRPVIVWATINMIPSYISSKWTDEDGNLIEWKANEHALVVIGYNDDNIIVSDPYTGSIRYYEKDVFIDRYNYLGKRAVWY